MSRTVTVHAVAAAASLSAFCLLLAAGCSRNGDPFSYVNASGRVSYDDGSLIPAPTLVLYFLPQTAAVGNAHPRVGWCNVDTKTGEFRNATTHAPHDGLVRGKHKVTITGPDKLPLPTNLVPAEYGDFKTTPLEVDTDNLPFVIKVAKPSASLTEK